MDIEGVIERGLFGICRGELAVDYDAIRSNRRSCNYCDLPLSYRENKECEWHHFCRDRIDWRTASFPAPKKVGFFVTVPGFCGTVPPLHFCALLWCLPLPVLVRADGRIIYGFPTEIREVEWSMD